MSAVGKGTLGQGVVFGTLTFAATAVLGLASSVVVARLYGVHVVGQFALAYAPTGAVWVLSTIREQPAFIRAIAPMRLRDPRATGLLAAVFTFSSLLTALSCAIAAAVAYVVFRGPVHQPHLFGLALLSLAGYFLLTNPCWNLDSVLVAYRAARPLFWLRLHQSVAYVALVVVAALISPTARSLVLATALAWLSPLLHRLVIMRRWVAVRVPREQLAEGFRALPDLLRFGIRLTPGTLAQGASDEVGTWALGAVGTVSAVGAYNRAWTLARRVVDLHTRLTEMLLPTLVERRTSGDRAGFDRALIDSVRYVAIVLLLPAAVAGGAAHGVLAVFGQGFGRAATALPLLMLVPAVAGISGTLAFSLLAHDRPTATTVSFLVRAVVTVPAVVLLALAFGVTGTALGMVVGCLAQLTCQVWLSRTYVQGSFWRLWPPRQMTALGLAFGATFLVARALDPGTLDVVRLVADLVAATLVYGGVLVFAGGVSERDKERARGIWSLVAGAAPSRVNSGASR